MCAQACVCVRTCVFVSVCEKSDSNVVNVNMDDNEKLKDDG